MRLRLGSPLRILAPLSLVAFTIAFFVVLGNSDVSEDQDRPGPRSGERGDGAAQRELRRQRREAARQEGELPERIYVVKAGDTLGGIAERTGIPVEELQTLNPDLDPQALVSGQRIKLRE